MSPTELKSLIAIMVAALAFFLVREFVRRDKVEGDLAAFKEVMASALREITERFAKDMAALARENSDAVAGLNKCVSELNLSIVQQREWFAERYISEDQHDREIERITADFQGKLNEHTTYYQHIRRI